MCCRSQYDLINYLKDEILTRVVGFGWADLKCAWSSSKDARVGSTATLTAHAIKCIKAEETRPVPVSPHCAVLERKSLPQLGSPSLQARLYYAAVH